MSKHIAVVGGGIAGMETASRLAQAGHRVTIIEKEQACGGKLRNWHQLFPDFASAQYVLKHVAHAAKHDNIKMISDTEITSIDKNGNAFILHSSEEMSIKADAVVVATGFDIFDATRKEEYGYGIFDNVITSAELEMMLRTEKNICTANGSIPKRIAIIHCVGSRDAKVGNTYCSKVCCITGIKQAIELNKHLPECEIFNFYMDLRLYGSNFDDLYLQAQRQHKIQFIRGRLSEASEKQDKTLQIKAEDTLSGRPLRMDVDMIVLLVGIEAGRTNAMLCANDLLQVDRHGFIESADAHFARNKSKQKGVFVAGTALCPMSVSDVLENARSAATEVLAYFQSEIK